jgi:hypothetical protein
MADRPRDDTWWIASDGKWYPPTLQPETANVPAGTDDIDGITDGPSTTGSTSVPTVLTRIVSAALLASSAAFAVAAVFGLRFGSALGSTSTSDRSRTAVEDLFLGWSSLALFAMVVTGAVVLVWTFQTSRAFDARGASGRRWRGAWTIGAWFIPFASFVLPKLVYNELEKISQVPFTGADIGTRWKEEQRSTLSDLWWLLWVAGLFMYQSTQVFMSDPAVDPGTVAVATSLSGAAHLVLAAAGVALVVVIRRIDSASRS